MQHFNNIQVMFFEALHKVNRINKIATYDNSIASEQLYHIIMHILLGCKISNKIVFVFMQILMYICNFYIKHDSKWHIR